MKKVTKEQMAEFLSLILPDDIELSITRVSIHITPDRIPEVEIVTTPCREPTYEIWNELKRKRGGLA